MSCSPRRAARVRLLAAVTLTAAFTVPACHRDDDDNPVSPELTEWTREDGARFPLAVGNRWEYQAVTSVNDKLSPSGSYHRQTQITLQVAARDTVLGQAAYRVDITHRMQAADTVRAHAWFTSRGDTLIGLATGGDIGRLEPRTGQLFKPVAATEAQPWGVAALVFPVQTGKTWALLPGTGLQRLQERRKKVEGVETVTVPAGEYECFRIVDDYRGDASTEGKVTQWYAPVGLVRCEETASHYGIRTDEQGNPLSGQPQLLQQVESWIALTAVELVEER